MPFSRRRRHVFAGGGFFVDSAGNVGALAVQRDHHRATLGFKADSRIGIADISHNFADDIGNVNITGRGDFTGDEHQARGHQRFAGNSRDWIYGEHGVKNRVGNLIRNLVRMSRKHRFGCEQRIGHSTSTPTLTVRAPHLPWQKRCAKGEKRATRTDLPHPRRHASKGLAV